MKTKVCPRCQKEKPTKDFSLDNSRKDKLTCWCRECKKAQSKEHHKNHRGKDNAQAAQWYDKNKKEHNKKSKRWYRKHKKERAEYCRKYQATHREQRNAAYMTRRTSNTWFRVACSLRANTGMALKGKIKAGHTIGDMGCNAEQLKEHLISLLGPNLRYEDYGKTWEIDHVVPLAYFDLTDRVQFLKAVNYKNLRPLGVKENRSKGSLYRGKRYYRGEDLDANNGSQPA